MSITAQTSEEILSVAYVYAVAAQAGVNITHDFRDYGVDLTLSHVRTLPSGARRRTGYNLHLQLKSTINSQLEDQVVVYDLAVQTYNDLVDWEGQSPCYLILMRLPPTPELRLEISEDALSLRDCCYWHKFDLGAQSENSSSVRVRIPRENKFTPEALLTIMDELRNAKAQV